MKKKMAILLLGIIVAVAVLAGCGGKKEAGSPVVGDYKLASVESGGMTVDVDEYKEMMGDDSLDMSLSIKSDGTFSIDAAGQSGEGTVSNIGIIYTKLTTVDNRQVVIPNGILSGAPLTNVTAQDKRRLIISVGIGYSSDLRKAKEILERLFTEKLEILKEDGVEVYVDSLGESSIVLTARGWTKTEDYWRTKWALTEAVKYAFDEAGIEIPYNKLDVNVMDKK